MSCNCRVHVGSGPPKTCPVCSVFESFRSGVRNVRSVGFVQRYVDVVIPVADRTTLCASCRPIGASPAADTGLVTGHRTQDDIRTEDPRHGRHRIRTIISRVRVGRRRRESRAEFKKQDIRRTGKLASTLPGWFRVIQKKRAVASVLSTP